MEEKKNNIDIEYLNELESKLSKEEENILIEISELQNEINNSPSFMSDFFNAIKLGSLNYIDSMTDTGDSFNDIKNSSSVNRWNNVDIEKTCKPSNSSRNIKEAGKSPFDLDSTKNVSNMSDNGKAQFERYKMAYSQRTKSQSNFSKNGNKVVKDDPSTNFETLSGLRSYRFGPVVPVPSMTEAKMQYEKYKSDLIAHNEENNIKGPSEWLYEKNLYDFDQVIQQQFGFKTIQEATNFRRSNNLTVHEGPDGMFLVPTDIHDNAKHNGYRSIMSKYLKGEISEEELNQYIRNEKVAFVKHEFKTRPTRLVKGIGLSIIKDILKHTIIVTCTETYNEFKISNEDSIINRVKRVLNNCWMKIKAKFNHIFMNLWGNIKGSILSELFTTLNDFIFKTFKNVFKVIRQMWGSLKRAFSVIKNGTNSWSDRIFEASKILSAGIVSIIGFSLNEVIEKSLMSLGIPFSSFIAECMSGLFAGILSAIVLMLFDYTKSYINTENQKMLFNLKRTKIIAIDIAKIGISSLKTDIMMYETVSYFAFSYNEIEQKRNLIFTNQEFVKDNLNESKNLLEKQKQNITRIKNILTDKNEF